MPSQECATEGSSGATIESGDVGGATEGAGATTVLDGTTVCPGAGYLCAGLEQRGTWRVLRWDETTEVIQVLVPLPPWEDPDRARALQNAAARGIRAWHRHPFPIRVEVSDRPGTYDIVVRWSTTLPGTELGHASTRWKRSGSEASLDVEDFSLATRSPFDVSRTLDPEQVELTAAHEMGHALGLPHSDRESDVMYPSNTATRLTARDFRTMEVLYLLENGAEIEQR